MKGDAVKLVQFLEGSQKRFVIPVYQRNYDWKKENCIQLYNDLVSLIKKRKTNHFFGSIVSYVQNKDVIIIDGQQRITTVSLIMIAMMNAIKKGALIPEDELLYERLRDTYILDRFRKEERKVRLKPFRNDCDAFDRLIFKDEEEYIEDSKVTMNYRYFYDRMVNSQEITLDELYTALESLEIIEILIEPDHGDDPQLIFESLNSTGLDLTESDKIRNFVLMGLPADVQEDYYNAYWSKIEKNCGEGLDNFVRDFLTIQTGTIANFKKIYAAFKGYHATCDGIESVLQNMTSYSKFYHQIHQNDLGNKTLNEIMFRLNLLDVTVAYPYLIAFLEYANKESMSVEEVEKVFSCIEVYVFRRQICDYPSNALNKIFASLHKSILKLKKETDAYSSVLIYFLESRTLSATFPKDEEFIQNFVTRNVYSMQKKNKFYLFERLENCSSKEKNDVYENLENKTYSIEHIMPQSLNAEWKQALGEDHARIQEEWLHTIANLTLTAYNPNYSNKTFAEKKTMENGFAISGLRLNQYIASFDQWTEAELKLRKAHLIEVARSIWKYPTTEFVPEEKDDEIVSLSEDYRFTGRGIKAFTLLDTQYTVRDWVDTIVEIYKQLYFIDPSAIHLEANNPENVWVSTKPFENAYRKIAEGIYLCTNNDTMTKVRLIKGLLHKYQLDEDDVTVILTPDRARGKSVK